MTGYLVTSREPGAQAIVVTSRRDATPLALVGSPRGGATPVYIAPPHTAGVIEVRIEARG